MSDDNIKHGIFVAEYKGLKVYTHLGWYFVADDWIKTGVAFKHRHFTSLRAAKCGITKYFNA